MPKHTIDFEIPVHNMGNVDITCNPRSDGRKLGTLELSKGGVNWRPRKKSVRIKRLTWERFAELMEHGAVPRKAGRRERKVSTSSRAK